MPRFSIVIPTYNRERLLGRAIDSCLNQSYTDFEVIVSDDGSSDGSRALVCGYADPRVHFLHGEQNRGLGPARNAGVDAATGEWIVFLDSDDELLPDALMTMDRCAATVASNVGRMVFMYQLDSGGYSPNPPFVAEAWDYVGYLRWLESIRGSSDCCNCIRRKTFEVARWAEDRAFEGGYLLGLALLFPTHAFPEVVGVVHSDAPNRASARSLDFALCRGRSNLRWAEEHFAKHEASMARHCPRFYRNLLQVIAVGAFLAGEHRKGWKIAGKLLFLRPLAWRSWVLMALGICNAKTFARIMHWSPNQIAHRRMTRTATATGGEGVESAASPAAPEDAAPRERKAA